MTDKIQVQEKDFSKIFCEEEKIFNTFALNILLSKGYYFFYDVRTTELMKLSKDSERHVMRGFYKPVPNFFEQLKDLSENERMDLKEENFYFSKQSKYYGFETITNDPIEIVKLFNQHDYKMDMSPDLKKIPEVVGKQGELLNKYLERMKNVEFNKLPVFPKFFDFQEEYVKTFFKKIDSELLNKIFKHIVTYSNMNYTIRRYYEISPDKIPDFVELYERLNEENQNILLVSQLNEINNFPNPLMAILVKKVKDEDDFKKLMKLANNSAKKKLNGILNMRNKPEFKMELDYKYAGVFTYKIATLKKSFPELDGTRITRVFNSFRENTQNEGVIINSKAGLGTITVLSQDPINNYLLRDFIMENIPVWVGDYITNNQFNITDEIKKFVAINRENILAQKFKEQAEKKEVIKENIKKNKI